MPTAAGSFRDRKNMPTAAGAFRDRKKYAHSRVFFFICNHEFVSHCIIFIPFNALFGRQFHILFTVSLPYG